MTERGTPGCVLKVGFHFAVCTGVRLSVWVLAEDRSANATGSPPDTTHLELIANVFRAPWVFAGAFAYDIWYSKTSSVHLGAFTWSSLHPGIVPVRP